MDVRDYVLFLRNRYGYSEAVDESDAWTEDDMRDIGVASMNHALQSVWRDTENVGLLAICLSETGRQ